MIVAAAQPKCCNELSLVASQFWPEMILRMHPAHRGFLGGVSAVLLAAFLGCGGSPNPKEIYERGRAALRQGDLDQARKAVAELEDSPKFSAHRALLRGSLLLREGKFAPALKELQQAAKQPELEIEALSLAGQGLYQSGDAHAASQLWQRVLALNPAHANTHRWLGVHYYDSGAMDLALEHLEKVSQLDSRDPRPDRLRGLIYKDFERYAEAVACYRESLRRDSKQPDIEAIRLELAECLIHVSDYSGALASLKECSPSAQKLSLQAECSLGLGHQPEAKELVDEALKGTPDFLPAMSLKAKILLLEGQAEAASEVLKAASAKHPKTYSIRFTLAQVLERLGKTEDARQEIARAEELKAAWLRFSDLNKRAIDEPFNAALRFELGQLAEQLDQAELGKTWYRAALAINPSHAEAKKALESSP